MKLIKRLSYIFVCATVAGNALALPTSAAEKTKITVACQDFYNFADVQSDGSVTGYGADLMNIIAEYTGWKYEFIHLPWSEALEKVKSGEIDFYLSASRTEERERDYDFSDFNICDEVMNLYVLPERDVLYEDFEAFDGMRVGVIKNSLEKSYFADFAASNDFGVNFSEFESYADIVGSLRDGKIDAAALVSFAAAGDLKNVANFGISPSYLMSCNGSELMREFRVAHIKAYTDNPNFFRELAAQYYPNETNILFTAEEMKLISDAGEIKVALVSDDDPISYFNSDGAPSGITYGILQRISEISGLKFSYEALDVGEKGSDYLKDNNNSIVAGIRISSFTGKISVDGIYESNSLAESRVVAAGRNEIGEINADSTYTIAVPRMFIGGKERVNAMYPKFICVDCETTADGLNMINSGEADTIIQNIYVLRQLMRNPWYADIEIYPAYSYDENLVAISDNELLISIINKSVASIMHTEIDAIIMDNTVSRAYTLAISDVLHIYSTQIIIGFIVVVAFVVLLVTLILIRQHNNRTLKATNERLRDETERAERASRAKSQFLAQMSHEIRTPMNSIIGFISLSKSDGFEDKLKTAEYFAKIETSSNILIGIINDILDMSAIEGGKLKIDKRDFDFQRLITSVSTMFYQQAQQKGVDFEVHMDTVVDGKLIGDMIRLNQVLLNLLSNAVKFTSAGGSIRFDVIQLSRDDEQVDISFSVADTGCGINDDMMRRLFVPFEQESTTTAKKYGGSGLGMSITKELVEMMGGKISVKSRVGWGTVFTVNIPFGIVETAQVKTTADFSGIRTLIVDDDNVTCDYNERLFKRFGISVDNASDGEKALEMLGEAEDKKTPYSLCIVDRRMPDMNGIEVIKEIRKIFGNDTTVVVLTSYDVNEALTQGLTAGADYVLQKPLFQSDVFNVLIEMTGGKHYRKINFDRRSKFSFKGKRVLVAEDVAINLDVAVELLKRVDIEVVGVADGRQAYEAYRNSQNNPFDCILLDINMPEMDGYQVAQAIRGAGFADSATVPIYAMTANAFSTDVEASMNAGMNGHISKPIDTKLLYETLSKAFENKKITAGKENVTDEQI